MSGFNFNIRKAEQLFSQLKDEYQEQENSGSEFIERKRMPTREYSEAEIYKAVELFIEWDSQDTIPPDIEIKDGKIEIIHF